MILPIFFLLPLCIVGKDIIVTRTGVRRISRLDVGMIFFVELVNEGKHQITVDTRMIGCCEILTIHDIECEYLHDRRGECEVVVSCRNTDDIDEIRKTISFDTTVSRKIPKVLDGYYERQSVKKCMSIDLDRLDYCRPVNCQIKYNGRRNYFNRELQRCQPVPVCTADHQEELPNMNVLCYHGYKDKHSGLCICDRGWTSQPLGNLEPINEYIRMCDVLVLPFPGLGNSPIHILFIIIAAVLTVLIVLFYCTMTIFMQVLPGKTLTEQSQQTRGSSYSNGSSRNFAHYSSTASRKKFNSGSNITYSKLSNSSAQSVKTRSK